jgi:deferrochelatase/peroxidase EfeB
MREPTRLPPDALAEVQRIVVFDPRRRRVCHVVLRLGPGRAGLDLVRELLPDAKRAKPYALTFASEPRDRTPLDISIGLTFAGLERMGVPPPYLGVLRRLAPAFAEGAAQRAAELGDVGSSAAEHWEKPAFAANAAHVVVTLHANTADELESACKPLRERIGEYGLVPLQVLDGEHLPRPAHLPDDGDAPADQTWVHFGYRDGLSRVHIRGVQPERGAETRAAGEFVLGYANEDRFNPWLLPLADEKMRAFFRNGSFGGLRKMAQDVDAFERQVGEWARRLAGDRRFGAASGDEWRDLVKAKLCGRRPDGGQPGVLEQGGPAAAIAGPPLESADHAFDAIDYAQDADGTICPYGAHTRRMNPRGGQLAHARIRSIIRRGVAYGPPYEGKPDGHERGLLGLFFCASIEEQFEHLLAQWAERVPLGSPDRGAAKDPLIGQHDDPDAAFLVPVRGGTRAVELSGWRPFVTTRGMLYAFYPSRQALRQMADRDYVSARDDARRSWDAVWVQI